MNFFRKLLLIAIAALQIIMLPACHGVDPLLANPPPATRPDIVLQTPWELLDTLQQASKEIETVKQLFSDPIWSDALGQSPSQFNNALTNSKPALASSAPAIQGALDEILAETAGLSETSRQIKLRLEAMETIREKTNFRAYIADRKDLYNQRADARAEQQKYANAAARYGGEAAGYRASANSYKVERIDYVNSSGKVVESRYTAAHDEKQRARLLLPFANAAARDMEESAAAERDKAERLDLIIAATQSSNMEAVESHLYQESDFITERLWPLLTQQRQQLLAKLETFSRLTGHPSRIPSK